MDKDDILVWSKRYLLKEDDFKADSNPSVFEDASSKIKYHYTWTVNSDKQNDKIYFNIEDIKLETHFLKHLSWIREGQRSSEMLNHEQGHFDLAEQLREQIVDKIQKKLYGKNFPTRGQNEEQRKQFAREDSEKIIAKELENEFRKLEQIRKKYDTDTNFGQNLEIQKQFDQQFLELRR